MKRHFSYPTKTFLCLIALQVACYSLAFGQAKVDESKASKIIQVTPQVGNLATGMAQAAKIWLGGTGVRVILAPGVYRDEVNLQTNLKDLAAVPDVPFIIEAANPGTVTISGADEVKLRPDTSATEIWSGPWIGKPASPNPWCGSKPEDKLQRPDLPREYFTINEVPLQMVKEKADLKPGTCYFAKSNSVVYINPPKGVDLTKTCVQGAMRPNVEPDAFFRLEGLKNLVLRGILFTGGSQAFYGNISVKGNNVLIEDCRFSGNNGTGLYVNNCSNMTIRRCEANFNGHLGIWGGAENLLLEDVAASHNSERVYSANPKDDWSAGGIKLLSSPGLHLNRVRTEDNFSTGLWLDTEVNDVLIENWISRDNAHAGFNYEASRGVTLKNVYLISNDVGIFSYCGSAVKIYDSVIANNTGAQIKTQFSGRGGVHDWDLTRVMVCAPSGSRQMLWTFDEGPDSIFDMTVELRVFKELWPTATFQDCQFWHENPRVFRADNGHIMDLAMLKRILKNKGEGSTWSKDGLAQAIAGANLIKVAPPKTGL